jgi:hypothetical protein
MQNSKRNTPTQVTTIKILNDEEKVFSIFVLVFLKKTFRAGVAC